MSLPSENPQFDAIEALLDEARVEEEVQLAVLEASSELDDPRTDEFSWSDVLLYELALDEIGWGEPV